LKLPFLTLKQQFPIKQLSRDLSAALRNKVGIYRVPPVPNRRYDRYQQTSENKFYK